MNVISATHRWKRPHLQPCSLTLWWTSRAWRLNWSAVNVIFSSNQIFPEISKKTKKTDLLEALKTNVAFTQGSVMHQTSRNIKGTMLWHEQFYLLLQFLVPTGDQESLNWVRFVFLCLLRTLVQTVGKGRHTHCTGRRSKVIMIWLVTQTSHNTTLQSFMEADT